MHYWHPRSNHHIIKWLITFQSLTLAADHAYHSDHSGCRIINACLIRYIISTLNPLSHVQHFNSSYDPAWQQIPNIQTKCQTAQSIKTGNCPSTDYVRHKYSNGHLMTLHRYIYVPFTVCAAIQMHSDVLK